MADDRILTFVGAAYEELVAFPREARSKAGRQLRLVQDGKQPADWKPMKTIGVGVNEIRIREASGAFRVIYIAKFKEAVYVLHCFEKKSQRTDRSDLEIATTRYRELIRRRAGL